MKLDNKINALLVSDLELSAIGHYLTLTPGDLSPLNYLSLTDADKTSAQQAFNNLDPEAKDLAAKALTTLTAPDQTATLHYSIGERSLSRLLLGWKTGENAITVLAKTGDHYSLSRRTLPEITTMLTQVLAAQTNLTTCNLSLSLSAITTIVFLALSDCYRSAWYRSMLSNTLPVESYTFNEISGQLNNLADDFRWPFLFLARVLPVNIARELSEEDIESGLQELLELKLIGKNDSDGASEQALAIYSLNEEAEIICNGLLNNAAKVAINISTFNDKNQIGHESLLLVRDVEYLWLFDLVGNMGAIASIGSTTLDQLLQNLLTLSPKKTSAELPEKLPADTAPTGPAAIPSPPAAAAAASHRTYYIGRGNESYGPYTFEELRVYASEGNLTTTDMVWLEDQKAWVRADTLPGFSF